MELLPTSLLPARANRLSLPPRPPVSYLLLYNVWLVLCAQQHIAHASPVAHCLTRKAVDVSPEGHTTPEPTPTSSTNGGVVDCGKRSDRNAHSLDDESVSSRRRCKGPVSTCSGSAIAANSTVQDDSADASKEAADRAADAWRHIGFLSEWQMYAQALQGDNWRGEKMDKAKIDKMSDQQIGQMYELMQAIQKQNSEDAEAEEADAAVPLDDPKKPDQ
ncbi:hypothetical protein OPT61_g8110 [Boeremia exigua]|uniref:Uncharacterized protein n=1 Tax=Boeremia exigua TaxID=749465 RepID=A0ACC2HZL4_9PLEO|nr:hypothetical protein OPT61_g8110 [Boeremia exigua]